MGRIKSKGFVKRDYKSYIILFTIVIAVALFSTAIVSLLPEVLPDIDDNSENGIARSFMFPFAFSYENNKLAVLRSDLKVNVIDDSIDKSVHDTKKGNIYYIRNGSLYEYNIKNDYRKKLTDETKDFYLFPNRTSILILTESNELALYWYGKDDLKKLTDKSDLKDFFTVGNNGVAYYTEDSEDKLSILYTNTDGTTKTIVNNVFENDRIYIDSSNGLISYYNGNIMNIVDFNGKMITSYTDSYVVTQIEYTSIVSEVSPVLDMNENVNIRYLLCDIYTSNNGDTLGKLVYLKGGKTKTIAENVHNIIYYSYEDDLLLYETLNENTCVYRSRKGSKGEKLLECEKDTAFLFDDTNNYLYFRSKDSILKRINVFDVKHKQIEIDNNVLNIYDYCNKPYVAYDKKDSEDIYLILGGNRIEKIEAGSQKRLYARSNTTYLLCTRYSPNEVALDIVNDEKLTRISDNMYTNVYFDKSIDNIIYISNDVMYVRSDGVSTALGTYGSIEAIALN